MRAQQDDDEANVEVHMASDLERRSVSGGVMIITGIIGGTLDKDSSAASGEPRQKRNTTRLARNTFPAHAY